MRQMRPACLIVSLMLGLAAAADPLGAGITYHGRLTQADSPATGEFDMRFGLFNAASGGSQVSPTLTFDGVGANPAPISVVDGLFSVELNFGSSPYSGQALWLRVDVRSHNDGSYSTLSPRQPLTASPFALYALNSPGGGGGMWTSSGADIFNMNAGNVGIGTADPLAKLHVAGSTFADGDVHAVNANNPQSSIFLGWATDLNGDDMARIRVAGNPPGADNGLDIQAPGNRSLMRILNSGSVGIGTVEPGAKLDVVDTSGFVGVRGSTEGAGGAGVRGDATAATGNSMGVQGVSWYSSSGRGVYGGAYSNTGATSGGYFECASTSGRGVYGNAYGGIGTTYGVYGRATSGSGYGVFSSGDFGGNGGKYFRIDHPLDPTNKYLNHQCVEGPEPLLIYRGTVALGDDGSARVELPDYFEAINRDFHYHLTPIGGGAPDLHVDRKIVDNAFLIAGGSAGLEVCWTVTGVRNDPHMQRNKRAVVEEKAPSERGKYQRPELYGQPPEMGIDFEREPTAHPGVSAASDPASIDALGRTNLDSKCD